MSHELQYKQATMEQRQIIYQSVETQPQVHYSHQTLHIYKSQCEVQGWRIEERCHGDSLQCCVCEPVALTQKHQVKLISFSCSWQMN